MNQDTKVLTSRRDFLGRSLALGAGVVAAGGEVIAPAGGTGRSGQLLRPLPEHPKPATFDRLDEAWYRGNIGRLQAKMRDSGVDAVLLADRWNVTYYTGLFHTTTERLFTVLIPAEGMNLTWFHPSLDRDLVASWWIQDRECYFDVRHAKDGFPDDGRVLEGETVDLHRWMWEGIRKRGYSEKTIGVDIPYDERARATVADVAPKAKIIRADETCLKQRMVKTPEELSLTQRAMNYWSRIHAFARDLILERGTSLIDHQIAMEATSFGVDLIMKDIKRDGRPHNAVGISVEIGVRSGIGTAFPHPNQFHHNPVRKGDALQVAGVVTVGGYGGELYRAYQLAPWDDHRVAVWEAHTEACRIQQRESVAGVSCSHVAKAVHDHQVKAGMRKYIYHRPAHGQGMEGHQAPYISLGDFSTLHEGMLFSNEPGLYDPENGFGYNHSDCILVTPKGGVPMGSVPMTREWCFLTI